MGYSTEFQGSLKLNRELTHKEWIELSRLGNSYDQDLYAEYTDTPETIPKSYLQWVPNEDGTAIVWNGGEKFYDYIHWLRWLIKHYLKEHGLAVNGSIKWRGDELEDVGIIYAHNNKITHHKTKVEGVVDCPNCGHRFVPND